MKNRKLNIAIIDDELHAIETLAYDLRTSFQDTVEIVFTATNPFEGARQVRLHKPDILFLDMMMPGLSGPELFGLINDLEVKVVFVTAYPELVNNDRKTNNTDCLLKPVSTPELEVLLTRMCPLA